MKEKTLKINKSLFDLDVIKKVIYRNAGEYQVELDTDDNNFVIRFYFEDISDEKWSDISNSFHRDFIDQDLRQKIFSETELVRNLILANAFSNAPIGTNGDS